jgi:hypothetical protein
VTGSTKVDERQDHPADAIISDCGGDARAAVIELLAIVQGLIAENQKLRETGVGDDDPTIIDPLIVETTDSSATNPTITDATLFDPE